jgi:hypothetical protein
MIACLFGFLEFPRIYEVRKVIAIAFYPGELTPYCMKYIIILKYLVLKPIQPTVEKKDSIQPKSLARMDIRSFKSGKSWNTSYFSERHVKMSKAESLVINSFYAKIYASI